jgi:hypothetical protein
MVDGQRLTAVQKFMFELTLVVLTDRRRQFADVDISNHFYAETTVFLATYVYLRFGRSRDLRFSRFWGTLWSPGKLPIDGVCSFLFKDGRKMDRTRVQPQEMASEDEKRPFYQMFSAITYLSNSPPALTVH